MRPKKNESLNPFGDDDFAEEMPEDEEQEQEIAEWLTELSDTLEVHIAQREFEQAVELIKEAEEEVRKFPSLSGKMLEVSASCAARKEGLLAVLRGELKVSPDKSLQGGPRTARRAVNLLSSLGQAEMAE